MTFRPEFQPPWVGLSNVVGLALARLKRASVDSMIVQVAAGRALPGNVMEQIAVKSDGNPLFVEELTKTLLEGQDRAGNARSRLPHAAIPATLKESLMARLDRLASVKDIFHVGATLGREFSYPLLHAVVGWMKQHLNTDWSNLSMPS